MTAVPMFIVTRRDPQWKAWIEFFSEEKRAAAEASGEITTIGSRWPDKRKGEPIIRRADLSAQSKHMMGDA